MTLLNPFQIDTVKLGQDPDLQSNIDHDNILNIGTNTHAQIDTHIVGTALNHTASDITNVPTGSPGIGATNVQLAIDELNNEKASLASPTFTGTAILALAQALRITEKRIAASPTTTYDADLENASMFVLTLGGNTSITFSNIPATTLTLTITFRLVQDATGSRTPSFPASVKWDGGTVPTWGTSNGDEDIITMFTEDGGTTWRANLVGQNYA